MGIRGTFHLAVDTNYIFHRSFFGKYKGVDFKYIKGIELKCAKGKDDYADCIVADIKTNAEDAYHLFSELVSAFSFTRDKAFIVDALSSHSDGFRGKLADRDPMAIRRRMMQVDFSSNELAGDLGIILDCPKIKTNDQSNLVRLYRLGKAEEYVNFISSFLFYYHIIDHPCSIYPGEMDVASKYINDFYSSNTDEYHNTLIENVCKNRVFNKDSDDKQSALGNYIEKKVRHSVAHITRKDWHGAHELAIDSLSQNAHFYHLKELLRTIARDKLKKHHGFDSQCDHDVLCVYATD